MVASTFVAYAIDPNPRATSGSRQADSAEEDKKCSMPRKTDALKKTVRILLREQQGMMLMGNTLFLMTPETMIGRLLDWNGKNKHTLEIQHLRVRAHLFEKPQAFHDPVVQINQFFFA